MVAYTKKRNHLVKAGVGVSSTTLGDVPTPYSIVGSQTVTSENHPNWQSMSGRADSGGAFVSTKHIYSDTAHVISAGPVTAQLRAYHGPLFARARNVTPTSSLWPIVTKSSDAVIDPLGTKAIAVCIPTNPVASAAVTMAEIRREGIPKVPGKSVWDTALQDYRKIGSEYLNLEFGWKPLVSGLLDFAKAVKQSDKVVRQLERNSGKNVRRSYGFPTESSTTVVTKAFGRTPDPPIYTGLYAPGCDKGWYTVERTTTTKRWFDGCFTYHVDFGTKGSMKYAVEVADKVYGLNLTPEVAYELTPWSWALDWVSNTGDIVHNMSAFANDGLVMRYGYMMETKTVTDVHTLTGCVLENGMPLYLSQTFTTEVKSRRKATPFGFGLNTSGFSDRQWAIIGALGISRGPKSLPTW